MAVKTLFDRVAEACRAQRVHELASAGMLDSRVSRRLPIDDRYAARVLKEIGLGVNGQKVENPIYQMVCYALVQRSGGNVMIPKLEYECVHGSFAWRFDEQGNLEMRAVYDSKAMN